MYPVIINGELAMDGSWDSTDQVKIYAESLDHLSAQLSINEEGDRSTHRCDHCGEEGEDQSDDPCPGSGTWIPCRDHELDDDGDCKSDCEEGETEVHDWEPIPLHWVNSASINARPDRDSISVSLSVGDPRGAFVMEISRTDDGGDPAFSAPCGHVHVPHAVDRARSRMVQGRVLIMGLNEMSANVLPGDGGKSYIKGHIGKVEVILYESLDEPGKMVVEVDIDDKAPTTALVIYVNDWRVFG